MPSWLFREKIERDSRQYLPSAVIPDSFYRKSILSFIMFNRLLVMPGFAPAGDLLFFREK